MSQEDRLRGVCLVPLIILRLCVYFSYANNVEHGCVLNEPPPRTPSTSMRLFRSLVPPLLLCIYLPLFVSSFSLSLFPSTSPSLCSFSSLSSLQESNIENEKRAFARSERTMSDKADSSGAFAVMHSQERQKKGGRENREREKNASRCTRGCSGGRAVTSLAGTGGRAMSTGSSVMYLFSKLPSG